MRFLQLSASSVTWVLALDADRQRVGILSTHRRCRKGKRCALGKKMPIRIGLWAKRFVPWRSQDTIRCSWTLCRAYCCRLKFPRPSPPGPSPSTVPLWRLIPSKFRVSLLEAFFLCRHLKEGCDTRLPLRSPMANAGRYQHWNL